MSKTSNATFDKLLYFLLSTIFTFFSIEISKKNKNVNAIKITLKTSKYGYN